MEDFIRAVSDLSGTTVLMLVVFGFVAIKQFYEAVAWAKARLEDWRDKKNGIEKKEASVESRLSLLEERGEWQYQELMKQSQTLDKIVEMMEKNSADQDAVTIATARATLNQIATKSLADGYISEADYETFENLAQIYLAKGGNHTMKQKTIPAVEKLPIK